MTFDEIVTEIADELNIVAAESQIRIGRLVNISYKKIITDVGMQTSARSFAEQATTGIGDQDLVYVDMYKITRLYYLTADGQRIFPRQVLWDELREETPQDSDTITRWAVYTADANTVTVFIDVLPETEFIVYADGYQVMTDLQDVIEPSFPDAFHDIIIDDVLRREYRKKGDASARDDARKEYEKRVGDLRFWHAKHQAMDLRQGSRKPAWMRRQRSL